MGRVVNGALATVLTLGAAKGGYEALESITAEPEYYAQLREGALVCVANYPDSTQPVEQLPPGCDLFAPHLQVVSNAFMMPSKAEFQHDAGILLQEQQASDRRIKLGGLAAGAVLGFSLAVALTTGTQRKTRPRSTTWLARQLTDPR